MATVSIGANIKTLNQMRGRSRLWKFLGGNWTGLRKKNIPIYSKAGVPSTNTAADSPGGAPAFILDTTNSDVYFCHTWVNDSSFTVVKVSN